MKKQTVILFFLMAGMGCSGTDSTGYTGPFPSELNDSIRVSGSIRDMTASGSRLAVLLDDSTGAPALNIYDANDLSLLGSVDLSGINGYPVDMINAGGSTVFIGFCSSNDTGHIASVDLLSQSVVQVWSTPVGLCSRPMTYHKGKIYHLQDSSGILWSFDPSDGSCDSTQAQVSPIRVGGMCSGDSRGIFVTGQSDNTLYLMDTGGNKKGSWAVEDEPGPVVWDGLRAYLTTRTGFTAVSPDVGKAPQSLLRDPEGLVVVEGLVMVAWADGVGSFETENLQYIGTGPTPEPVNLIAASSPDAAFVAKSGKSVIYEITDQQE